MPFDNATSWKGGNRTGRRRAGAGGRAGNGGWMVSTPSPSAAGRADRIDNCARGSSLFHARSDADVEPRAVALTEDDVEQLGRRRVGVAMLGNAVDAEQRIQVRVRVVHFAAPG